MSDVAENHSENLDRARQEKPSSSVDTAKNLSKMATPAGAFSALKQVNLLKDMPFVCAFGFAILKDILDLVFAPTIILSMVFSILCSIFIFMMLLLAGSSGKRKAASGFMKGGILIGGGIADSIPGVDFFPVETITVGIIYFMTLSERASADK